MSKEKIEEQKKHFDTANVHEQVEIFISCKNLIDLDNLDKSDPYAILNVQDENSKEWCSLGKTEVVANNLNPSFSKSFMVNYIFEKNQILKVEIFDADDGTDDDDLIGYYTVPLNQILTSKDQTKKGELITKEGKSTAGKRGSVKLKAEPVASSNKRIIFVPKCNLVPKKT